MDRIEAGVSAGQGAFPVSGYNTPGEDREHGSSQGQIARFGGDEGIVEDTVAHAGGDDFVMSPASACRREIPFSGRIARSSIGMASLPWLAARKSVVPSSRETIRPRPARCYTAIRPSGKGN